jgi:hypothetical protein
MYHTLSHHEPNITCQPTAVSPRYEGSISTLNTRTNECQTGAEFPSNSESDSIGNPERLQTLTKFCERLMLHLYKSPLYAKTARHAALLTNSLFPCCGHDGAALSMNRSFSANSGTSLITAFRELKRWSSHSADG